MREYEKHDEFSVFEPEVGNVLVTGCGARGDAREKEKVDKMTTNEAAEIIMAHVTERDDKARAEGLNSVAWGLRRVGDISEILEFTASDVLSGRGVSLGERRKLIRVAKSLRAA